MEMWFNDGTYLYNQRTHPSLVPRPSHCPVFGRLQYAKIEGEGLVHFITCMTFCESRNRVGSMWYWSDKEAIDV